jgi:hypothetical protein
MGAYIPSPSKAGVLRKPGGSLPGFFVGNAGRQAQFGMTMSEPLRYPDPGAHEPGCMKVGPDLVCMGPAQYADIFCDCHHYTEPKILSNGTDIAWPAGWDETQAFEWRGSHGLASPVPD